MNLDDRLARARAEVADEVASGVRVPSFASVLARRAHRRRIQVAAAGSVLTLAVVGVVVGVAATAPGSHARSVPPIASVTANRPPTSAPMTSPSTAASATVSDALSGPQTYPAKGVSYVVVPDGSQFAWTDLKTGAHGHFGPTSGHVSSPSVSADGRRIAYLTNPENGIAVWDLDSRTAQEVMPEIDIENAPAISPDGTKVLWTEHAIIRMAEIGVPSSTQTVTADGSPAAWDGNGAIVYPTNDINMGGRCAVMRLDLAAGHATRCLLPVATLQAVFAPDGSTWQIGSISGVPGGGVFALGLWPADAGGGPEGAVGVLTVWAEATPFKVLPSTVVADASTQAVADPVLIDRATRLVYAKQPGPEDQGPAGEEIYELDIATGVQRLVLRVGDTGLGAASG